jgi:hypothetical protein
MLADGVVEICLGGGGKVRTAEARQEEAKDQWPDTNLSE